MFTIDPRSRQPIYEQLEEQIIRYVSLGVLQPLDRMPSVRILARELGINPNTVVKTYQELEDEGILITEPKKGFFVSDHDVHAILCLRQKEEFRKAVIQCQETGISEEEALKIVKEVYEGKQGSRC